MKSDYEEYRDTGMLGAYSPEEATDKKYGDCVATLFPDTRLGLDDKSFTKERRMLIEGRRFRIISVFGINATGTVTDRMLSVIDADLEKEAHSA